MLRQKNTTYKIIKALLTDYMFPIIFICTHELEIINKINVSILSKYNEHDRKLLYCNRDDNDRYPMYHAIANNDFNLFKYMLNDECINIFSDFYTYNNDDIIYFIEIFSKYHNIKNYIMILMNYNEKENLYHNSLRGTWIMNCVSF